MGPRVKEYHEQAQSVSRELLSLVDGEIRDLLEASPQMLPE